MGLRSTPTLRASRSAATSRISLLNCPASLAARKRLVAELILIRRLLEILRRRRAHQLRRGEQCATVPLPAVRCRAATRSRNRGASGAASDPARRRLGGLGWVRVVVARISG